MTTLLELYENGVIGYLVKNRIVSCTMLSYIEYYKEYSKHRQQGMSYRGAVKVLSAQHGVSETTIKKGIRMVRAAESDRDTAKISNLIPSLPLRPQGDNVYHAVAS